MQQIIIALIEFFLIIGSAYGLSLFLIKKLFNFHKLEYIILRIILGFGIISFITLFLATFHILNIYAFILVLIIGNILLIKDIHHFKDISLIQFKSIWIYPLITFFLFNFFYSLFPPTFYDSMMYHLAIPNYYQLNDGIISWNTNFNSNLPLNIEMLFLFSLLGKTVLIPKLISLISGIFIILLMSFWAKDKTSKFIYFIPLLLFYTIPQFGFLSSSSKTDITGMLFVFAALRVFFYYLKDYKKQYLILSGIFWGLSIGSKYIFGFYIIGFFISIFLIKSIKFKKKIISIVIISLIVIILMTPWFIKNTIITGNPLYPYLNSFFHSDTWTKAQGKSFSTGIQRGERHTFLKYIYYPLELFLRPYSYGITAVYGVFFLFFFPFVFFSEKKNHIKILKYSGFFSFILIMPFALVPRYFLMSFLLLTIPIASGVSNILRKQKHIKKYLIIIIALLISFNLIMQISLQEKIFQGFSYLKFKIKSNDKNLKYLYTLPYYRPIEFLNKNLSDKEKVLFLGEDRSFYLEKNFYLSSFNDRNELIELIKHENSIIEVLNKLKKNNFTHIIFSKYGLERMSKMSIVYKLSDNQKQNLFSFLSTLKLIYKDKLYDIYKI